jgi:hypothetical protein
MKMISRERLTFYCGGAVVVCDKLGKDRVDFLLDQASKGNGPLLVEEFEGGPRWVFPVGATAVKYDTVEDYDPAAKEAIIRALAGQEPGDQS